MLGDLGGATEVILIMFGIIFHPISEFSFWVKAIQKFYIVKSNKDLFRQKSDNKVKGNKWNVTANAVINKANLDSHQVIKINFCQKLKLFASQKLCCLRRSKNIKDLASIFDEGSQRITKELNLVNIL
jgi:hypothetical protein